MSHGMPLGLIFNPSDTFTRPNDSNAYTSGDLVANNTTAASVVPLAFIVTRKAGYGFSIRRAQLTKSNTTSTNAKFLLHLYLASPVPVNGDNGAWSTPKAGYLGAFSFDMTGSTAHTFSDGLGVIATPEVGTEIDGYDATDQTIYGLVSANAAYSPAASEVFIAELEVCTN